MVQSEQALRTALARGGLDLVICDYQIPGFGGFEALAIVKAFDPDLPVILVSGTIGEDAAVAAMRGGAHDYVLKDNLARLSVAVERALEDAQARRDRRKQERAQRFLAEAGATLAESLDYQTTLSRVARLAVPELGEVCAVELVIDGTSERVVVAHADVDQALPLERHAQRIAVPLEARGRVLGTLSFGTSRPGRVYGSVDLETARELARRAALAVDNAKLYAEAQQAIRARDEFLSIASHELKTPLTALQLQLQGAASDRRAQPAAQASGCAAAARRARSGQSTSGSSKLVDEPARRLAHHHRAACSSSRERFDLVEASRERRRPLQRARRARRLRARARRRRRRSSARWDRLRVEQVLIEPARRTRSSTAAASRSSVRVERGGDRAR